MSRIERIQISRRKFIGLGLSAALVSSAVSPYAAKAQTVNFNAATSAKLSSFCRGDGTDETDKINEILLNYLFVEIDEPPAGVGYGVRSNGPGGGGLVLRSGHEINGRGANAKLLRVGAWAKGGKCFRNGDVLNGNSSIKLNNIYVDGFRNRPDVPDLSSDADSTGIAIGTQPADTWCNDIQLTGVQVHNWPGVAIRVINGSNVTYTDVKAVNSARGGVIFNTSKKINLLRVTAADTGDDAIAFYVTGKPSNRPVYGITVDQCVSYTRTNPEYGAALKLAGAWEAQVRNSTFRNARNSLVFLTTFPGFNPRDIAVNNCTMLGGMKHSFQISANGAQRISARGNYMNIPDADCVNVTSLDGKARTLDVTVTDNTLSKPGSTKHLSVQDNLSGVNTKGNRLIYEYTTSPRIQLREPKPGSTVKKPVRKIEAFAIASVSRRNNDLRKGNIKLFINNRRTSSFDYYSSGALVKDSPVLRTGKNTVRVEIDFVGKITKKSWTFSVRG